SRSVELVGPVGSGATGVVASIVHDGDRALASDRGVAPSFTPEELEEEWVACDVLHLSGYALLQEPIAAAALLAARLARKEGAGDAVAAGFLVGGSLEQAARRGLDAAARCVAKVGSLP